MKNLAKLEREAIENIELAQHEIETANKLKQLSKMNIKRAKARRKLVNQELKVAKIREDLANEKRELSKKKQNLKNEGILEFSEKELKGEREYAFYYQNLAKSQLEIAQNNEKIIESEKKLAKIKQIIAKEKIIFAKERKKLAGNINSYVKSVRNNESAEKIADIELTLQNQRKNVSKIQTSMLELENKLKLKQNNISDFQKELSLKLSENEKIRHKPSLS